MTTKESMALIGRKGLLYESRGMSYNILVLDVKSSYGRTRLLVRPASGTGKAWVEQESVVIANP